MQVVLRDSLRSWEHIWFGKECATKHESACVIMKRCSAGHLITRRRTFMLVTFYEDIQPDGKFHFLETFICWKFQFAGISVGNIRKILTDVTTFGDKWAKIGGGVQN